MSNRIIVAVFIFALVNLAPGFEEKVIDKDKLGPSYVYVPKNIDTSKTYWVVVGVHGARGKAKGAAGIANWADKKDNVIVVSPQYASGYQNAYEEHQKKLIRILKAVAKQYKIHPRVFLYGFSGGAQFTHRFAMQQPGLVCGVSAHSGGSWATRSYGKINPKAGHIPFAISCGEKDLGKAWKKAPLNRLDWFNEFAGKMKSAGYCIKYKTWPKAGHSASKGVWELTEECFALATTGALPNSTYTKKLPKDSGWSDNRLASRVRKKYAARLKKKSKK